MIFLKLKNKEITFKLLAIFLIFIVLSFITGLNAFGYDINKHQKLVEFKKRQQFIEIRRKKARQQIIKIKKQEYRAAIQLHSNQQKLQGTVVSLRDQQYRLSTAKVQLDRLESSLLQLSTEEKNLKQEVAQRIRQIYKGERLSLLHIIFGAKDISTFLDRLYYQQRMIKRDKVVLEKLKIKTSQISDVKETLNTQKQAIVSTINAIEERRKEIALAVRINKDLIYRLQHDRNSYEMAEDQLSRESNMIQSTIQSLMTRSSPFTSYTTGEFIWPLYGRITSQYGYRKHPIFGSRRMHTGLDISAPYRTPVHAANSGKVIFTGWYGGYGNVVIIDHGKSISTLYAHLSSIAIANGQSVTKGSVIAYEGSTGYSTGPHLHFEVRVNGQHTNPLRFLK